MKSIKLLYYSRKSYNNFVTIILFLLFNSHSNAAEPILKIHYLGHSAFVLEFDNDVTVVTDYGEPNAWLQWGWDSPIHDIGSLVPDVMTYSHTHHEDHYDESRIPRGVQHILIENDSLTMDGLSIKPIRVCESNLNNEDNSAYLFSYKGFNFLHLGDAQVQIMNINNQTVRAHIQEIIPVSLDLLFMTIEGPNGFIEEAESFVDLLQPKRIIPMHYWSEAYKNSFLSYLTAQNDSGKNYQIIEVNNSKFEIEETDLTQPVKVVTLTRSAYTTVTGVIENDDIKFGFNLNLNYPNPFNPSTTMKFSIPKSSFVTLKVYDVLGKEKTTLVNEEKSAGNYEVIFDARSLASGIYFYRIEVSEFVEVKKMILLK
jgi:L-ascorbate metabolism protein UlaG (beta-lactamase superfamily)